MNQVPNMISTKDLSYLEDMFNWNFNASKKAFHFSKEVVDPDIQGMLNQCVRTHSDICKQIVTILKGGSHE